jgi:hypothetical protein
MTEPIAFVTGVRQFDTKMVDTVLKVGTPLYIHPMIELTDDEIKKIYGKYFDEENCDEYHLQCIRAIIKASKSEK